MATLEAAAFIVDVLGSRELLPDECPPAVEAARRLIAERYAELKRTLPFDESARRAKAEWLAGHLSRVSPTDLGDDA